MEFQNIILDLLYSPVCEVITNKNFISYLTKNINFLYGVKGQDLTFPAPQPASIEKKNFYNWGCRLRRLFTCR